MATDLRNRRELFREYMRNLTAGASPKTAILDGLYVAPPSKPIADRLVPRVDLMPAASHLVVGGIGTGKTTELLKIERQLASVPDVTPVYIDVALYHDLSELKSGVLTVIAGLAIDRLLTKLGVREAASEREQFRRWAHGYTEWFEEHDVPPEWEPEDDDDPDFVPAISINRPGVLSPPEPALTHAISEHARALAKLVEATRHKVHHVVLMLDSLDRVSSVEAFDQVVVQDVRAVREIGIGTVVVGPLTVLFGTHRPTADRFDYVYQVPAIDMDGPDGLAFLRRVLSARVPAELLPTEAVTSIAHFSGGVLRDLIALARSAGEEAYVSGSSSIQEVHVNAAVDSFGRDLMLGLGQKEIDTLQLLRTRGVFVQTSDEDIALLATRRVLEYGDSAKRYVVHPAIEPLLVQLSAR